MVRSLGKKIAQSTHDMVFRAVHGNCLVYNTCWEDPRIDRELMRLDGNSQVVMITSAGCNALDYTLDGPAKIHCVDVNPRQNSLLQLKIAALCHLDHDDLFHMFGHGAHAQIRTLYRSRLRDALPAFAREYWDGKLNYFEGRGRKKSFYYYGSSGSIAWILTRYLYRARRRVREQFMELLQAPNLEAQRHIYNSIEPEIWGRFVSWLVRQPAAMAMVGVPRPQIRLIKETYPGGMVGFVNDKLRHVFTEVPIADNYFWRVYLTGRYEADCCPNYLLESNRAALQHHMRCIETHTTTLTDFLKNNPAEYSHYVLLDHQDWLASHNPAALAEEWQTILQCSRPGTNILLRSASERVDFLPQWVLDRLRFDEEGARRLHPTDRVGTYGSMYFAEVL